MEIAKSLIQPCMLALLLNSLLAFLNACAVTTKWVDNQEED